MLMLLSFALRMIGIVRSNRMTKLMEWTQHPSDVRILLSPMLHTHRLSLDSSSFVFPQRTCPLNARS